MKNQKKIVTKKKKIEKTNKEEIRVKKIIRKDKSFIPLQNTYSKQ